MKSAILVGAVLLFGLLSTACSGDGDDDGDAAEATPEWPVEQVITVTASGRSFDPVEVTVPAGKVVEIELINTDGDTDHHFYVENLRVQHAHRPGAEPHGNEPLEVVAFPETTRSVIFLARGTTRFRFICKIEGHAEAGMVGTLILQ